MSAHLKLVDGFRHVTPKPADLAGHPVTRDFASPVPGPASKESKGVLGCSADLARSQVLLQCDS